MWFSPTPNCGTSACHVHLVHVPMSMGIVIPIIDPTVTYEGVVQMGLLSSDAAVIRRLVLDGVSSISQRISNCERMVEQSITDIK